MKTSGNKCQKGCEDFGVHSQKYSEASSFARYDEQSTVDDNPYVEDISPSTTNTLRELETPSSRGENLREDNQSLNGSWDERGLWMSNLGWPAPIDSMSPNSWHQDAMGDIENQSQIEFNDRPWIDSPNSWRSLCVTTQLDCRALSRNADICNLLERYAYLVSVLLFSHCTCKIRCILSQILVWWILVRREHPMML
jgi:protein neuralized